MNKFRGKFFFSHYNKLINLEVKNMLQVMISQFGRKRIFYHAYLISLFKLSFQEFLEMMLSQANNDLPDENLDIADIFKVLNIFATRIFNVLIFFHFTLACQGSQHLLHSMSKNLKVL